MYAYIIGKVVRIEENYVILENNGIGYKIFMPYSNLIELEENTNEKIYTYYSVSEDDISLYGFSNLKDKSMFEKLISVSKIGVKTAIGILSNTTAENFATAVVTEDVASLSKIPGIGKKTAQRIILEIKDKIDTKEMIGLSGGSIDSNKLRKEREKVENVTDALKVLGYTDYDIQKVIEDLDFSRTTEELIKDALKIIN